MAELDTIPFGHFWLTWAAAYRRPPQKRSVPAARPEVRCAEARWLYRNAAHDVDILAYAADQTVHVTPVDDQDTVQVIEPRDLDYCVHGSLTHW